MLNRSVSVSDPPCSPEWLVGSLFGIITGIMMAFPAVAFGPFGLPILSFLGIFGTVFAFLSTGIEPVRLGKGMQRLLVMYFAFVAVYGLMFVLSGSTTGSDIHFLFSTGSNAFWIILLLIISRKNFRFFNSFAFAVVLGFASLITAIWGLETVRHMDPFFARNDSIANGVLSVSVFMNPNILARSAGTVLPLLYFFYIRSTVKLKRNSLVLFLVIMLNCIVIATLSRANFLAILFFLAGVVSYRRVTLGRSSKIKWKRTTAIVLIALSVTVAASPTIRERLYRIQDMVQKTWDVALGSDARMLPIRFRTWWASIRVIGEKPFTGVGYSHIDSYQEKYGGVKYLAGGKTKPLAVHSGFLKIAAYGGLFSLGLFLIFYYKLFQFARWRFRTSLPHSMTKQSAYCLCLLLIMLLPMNIGADNFGNPLTWLIIAILTGYLYN